MTRSNSYASKIALVVPNIWQLPRRLLCSVVVATAFFTATQSLACTVNGGAYTSIQDALNAGEKSIHFTGTCPEFVPVHGFGITISGDGPAASTIVLPAGRSVGLRGVDHVLRNLKVDGNNVGNGIFICNGSFAHFEGVTLVNTRDGLLVCRNSGVRITEGWSGNSFFGPVTRSCGPFCIGDNSSARIRNTTVTNGSSSATVTLYRGGSMVVRGGTTIANTASRPAIDMFDNSQFRADDRNGLGTDVVDGNFFVSNSSIADIRATEVNGNLDVDLHSVFRLGSAANGRPEDTVVAGNIELSRDAALSVESPDATINGDIVCADDESSMSGVASGDNTSNCTGFDKRNNPK